MQVKVDHSRCQGHARCWALAPELFQLDDSGYITPGDVDVPAEHDLKARRAVRGCPERALSIVGDETMSN